MLDYMLSRIKNKNRGYQRQFRIKFKKRISGNILKFFKSFNWISGVEWCILIFKILLTDLEKTEYNRFLSILFSKWINIDEQ